MHSNEGARFEEPTPDTGCGIFNPDRLTRASSSRPGATVGSYAALVLDKDPTTAWVDNEEKGGVGAWVQVPTLKSDIESEETRESSLMRTVRGLAVQSGPASVGLAHPASVQIDCVTVKNDIYQVTRQLESLGTHDLKDVSTRQEIRFAKPQPCLAVRLTVTKLHGKPTDHVTIGELEPLY